MFRRLVGVLDLIGYISISNKNRFRRKKTSNIKYLMQLQKERYFIQTNMYIASVKHKKKLYYLVNRY